MSKLDELIKELCTNGVEYRYLGDFATITRGGNFQKKDFAEIGVPCIHYGQIYTLYELFTDRAFTSITDEAASKSKFAFQNDIIMAVTSENVEDVCKSVAWLGSDNIAISGHTAIINHKQNPKYLSYYFHSSMFFNQKIKLAHGTKVIEVTLDKLKNILIPLPPLPVQQEIVQILDNFTDLILELTSEMTARRNQYKYYRDKLFSINNEMIHVNLNDICEISRGCVMSKEYLRNNAGEYPVYSSQTVNNGIFGFIDSFDYEEESITWTTDGSNAGSVFYHVNEKFSITNVCGLLRVINKSEVNTKYIYYVLQIVAKRYVSLGMGNPKLMNNVIDCIKIPLPSLKEQKRIVDILDRFDGLINNITQGLPAEIEARRKQYEYYRDKLLTFVEMRV